MAHSVQIAILLPLLVAASCGERGEAQSAPPSKAARELKAAGAPDLHAASEKLYQYVSGENAESFKSLRGQVGLKCEADARSVVVTLRNQQQNDALSVITPDGLNLRIYYPENGGYLASDAKIDRSPRGAKITIFKGKTSDPIGAEEDGVYSAIPIWKSSGKYAFIETGYLPTWNADFDGKLFKRDFEVKSYCSVDLE